MHRITKILLLSLLTARGNNGASLEDRVAMLERTVEGIEESLVTDYGLVKRCRLPEVKHGRSACRFEDLTPGTECKVVCDAGFIATPGHEDTACLTGGEWERDLACEIPLLVVSGGVADGSSLNSSVEVISLYDSEGCDFTIPDMPEGGNMRSLHSLIFNPGSSPPSLLACNSMGKVPKTTCDSWQPGDVSWTYHSSPHMSSSIQEARNKIFAGWARDKKKTKLAGEYGRYAASAETIDEEVYIIGGMKMDGTEHLVTKTNYKLTNPIYDWKGETYWNAYKHTLTNPRAFFCTIPILDSGFVATGGYSTNGTILKSVEAVALSTNWTIAMNSSRNTPIPDMLEQRSGHGCSRLPADQSKIIVSGGSHSEHGESLASTEIFDEETQMWTKAEDMNEKRFGHAIVTVGERVVALGGKERHPDVVLDTMEEYSGWRKGWVKMNNKLSVPRANFGYTLVPHSIFQGCKMT